MVFMREFLGGGSISLTANPSTGKLTSVNQILRKGVFFV
jgi:hypothetical protein